MDHMRLGLAVNFVVFLSSFKIIAAWSSQVVFQKSQLEPVADTEGRYGWARLMFPIPSVYPYVEVDIGTPPQTLTLAVTDGPITWVPFLSKISGIKDCLAVYGSGDLCDLAEISGIYDPLSSQTCRNLTIEAPRYRFFLDEPDYSWNTTARVTWQHRGQYITDTISINGIQAVSQAIGLADKFTVTAPTLGLGVPHISPDEFPPTFLENLRLQGKVNSLVWSVWANDYRSREGRVYFGAIDEGKFYGELKRFDTMAAGGLNVTGVFWVDGKGGNSSLSMVVTDQRGYRRAHARANLFFGDQ
ncbi:hypothetical protein TWF730_003133 [Orbilia blumenaviensis]|uniref:Peptidase A1 domain-containing protein n=1 Tax=Orbilia blumenaviensis TaxID=1796055 RepID=A0AAV9U8U7_9PEZI